MEGKDWLPTSADLTLLPWSWRQQLSRKHRFPCTSLHGVTSCKTEQHIVSELHCQFNLYWEDFNARIFFQGYLLNVASYVRGLIVRVSNNNNIHKREVIPVLQLIKHNAVRVVEVSGQLDAPATLTWQTTPGTHCVGGWVNPRAGLALME
jgi:hypothetical protein